MKPVPHISQADIQKGRGSQTNPRNTFLKQRYEESDDAVMAWHQEEEDEPSRTQFIEIFPKSILSKNNSPDLGFDYSINPYNGCEHGCTYCYARNSHEYWGYSAGIDFEQKILIKKNAAQLLETEFKKKSWDPQLIVFSGNTDCYQPAERKFELTRECLKVFEKYRHPVGMITKNALILRDLDILKRLNEQHLIGVTLSITTLREDIRRVMEPRTSTIAQRLKTVETLVKLGIPVNVNMAPIIPGINSDEIFDVVKAVGDLGVESVSYIMVRLNGQIGSIFEAWVTKAFPERAQKILHQIKESHGGTLNESSFATRMKGEGKFAEQVRDLFRLARKKYIHPQNLPPLNFDAFKREGDEQLRLF